MSEVAAQYGPTAVMLFGIIMLWRKFASSEKFAASRIKLYLDAEKAKDEKKTSIELPQPLEVKGEVRAAIIYATSADIEALERDTNEKLSKMEAYVHRSVHELRNHLNTVNLAQAETKTELKILSKTVEKLDHNVDGMADRVVASLKATKGLLS